MQKTYLLNFWKQNYNFREIELDAFDKIKREDFIPEPLKESAYDDNPLPLLRGKTISQPTTVMIMTSALELQPGEKIFEIGTGSGYQTAIIAELVGKNGKVISTEVIPELIQFAKQNIKKAGLSNISIYEEDGSIGFEKHAPFDKIIITAACKEFPPKLIGQLKEGGIIVGPVGDRYQQIMVKSTKEKGKLNFEFLGPFLFTPMYGQYGFEI